MHQPMNLYVCVYVYVSVLCECICGCICGYITPLVPLQTNIRCYNMILDHVKEIYFIYTEPEFISTLDLILEPTIPSKL